MRRFVLVVLPETWLVARLGFVEVSVAFHTSAVFLD